MALTHPLLGLAALAVLVVAAALAWLWPRRPDPVTGALPFAAAARLRALPRFQELARHRRRWLVTELACLAVAAVAVSLLVARPVLQNTSHEERANRDVMLCLDVSGSMRPVVQGVLGAFEDLARELAGERIGLVLFDSAAVTVFPLTDDAAYIRDVLQATAAELEARDIPGTRLGDVGSSLIGDGLASCLLRFDRDDPARSRTVVLATDNQTSGKSLFTLAQATDKAIADEVLVFGIAPADNALTATDELSAQAQRTGGRILLLGPRTDLGAVTQAVDATQRRALAGPSRPDARELTWPPAALAGLGLAGAAYARRKGRS
ncbi:vWA domain-containing protein [Tessaracoccus massiliensis]|uniref:vWA domain-containing protein n=1 Tax=Tessaracoccus massiliensis TaxID=1522311 RepID=UPI000694CEA7|nr:VWA domain-containing protein [Tessaracoccus massiliensis]